MARTAGQGPPQSDRGAAIPGSNRGACRDRWREGCVARSRSCTRPGGLEANRERGGGPAGTGSRSARRPSRDLRNGDRHVRPANLLHLGVADIVEVSHHLREPRTRGVELRGGVGIRAATSAQHAEDGCELLTNLLEFDDFLDRFRGSLCLLLYWRLRFWSFRGCLLRWLRALGFRRAALFARARSTSFCHSLPPVI